MACRRGCRWRTTRPGRSHRLLDIDQDRGKPGRSLPPPNSKNERKKKCQQPDIFQIAFSNSKKKKNNNKEKDFTSSVFFFFPFRNKPRNPPLFLSWSLRGASEKCGRRQKEGRGQKQRCGSRLVTECGTLWQRRRDDLRRRGSCFTKRTRQQSQSKRQTHSEQLKIKN